jgi:hypothetical protein
MQRSLGTFVWVLCVWAQTQRVYKEDFLGVYKGSLVSGRMPLADRAR